jgi:hypothetical protein
MVSHYVWLMSELPAIRYQHTLTTDCGVVCTATPRLCGMTVHGKYLVLETAYITSISVRNEADTYLHRLRFGSVNAMYITEQYVDQNGRT